MANRILLVVEGSKTEPNVFRDVFKRYGFETVVPKEKINVGEAGQLSKYIYGKDGSLVVIVEGPRNRIHDFLLLLKKDDAVSIEKALSYEFAYFQKIFLLYDVDHNDCDDVEEMFSRFSDESMGMLLLSSPCIEVLGDFNRSRKGCRYCHLSEYKAEINNHWQGTCLSYIVKHFEEIMLYFLEKNRAEFNETNIMEHPQLIVETINCLNERVNLPNKCDSYVIYRYFSTVVYVAIASSLGLTREINNYEIVKSFFEKKKDELKSKQADWK